MTREQKLQQLAKQSERAYSMNMVLVDCGHCGATQLHEVDDEEYTCPFCGCVGDPSDFPDHFYEGFEQSAEFDYMQDDPEFVQLPPGVSSPPNQKQ